MKILVFDLETAPILARVWRAWKENIPHKQIQTDWHLMSWAAKWLGDPPSKMMYMDQRRSKDMTDDKKIVDALRKLINEADVIIAHNGLKFDFIKINARMLEHGMKPPAPTKKIDTCYLARKHFGFTHNSLEALSDKLCKKYKKLKHKEFPGYELWDECLKGNPKAWREMEKYNKHDVLALEELYQALAPWDQMQFMIHGDDLVCKCGSSELIKRGYAYTACGKFQRYACNDCGHWTRDTRRWRNVSRTGVVR